MHSSVVLEESRSVLLLSVFGALEGHSTEWLLVRQIIRECMIDEEICVHVSSPILPLGTIIVCAFFLTESDIFRHTVQRAVSVIA